MNYEIPASKEYLEKLKNVLEIINDRYLLNESDVIFKTDIQVPSLTAIETADILKYLARVKVVHSPKDAIFMVVNKTAVEIYLSRLKTAIRLSNNDAPAVKNEVYRIALKGNEIFINGFFFSETKTAGGNHPLIKFLLDHPNKSFSARVLKGNGILVDDLYKFLQHIRFTGVLGKIFFKIVSNTKIMLRNPVTKQDLQELNMPPYLHRETIFLELNDRSKAEKSTKQTSSQSKKNKKAN